MNLQIPYFTYSHIGEKAQVFLSEHHVSLELPIPIEEIIDVNMGLDIVPFPNLYRDYGLSGYLSPDRTAIFVDQFQAENYEGKYRFTLAHELGHYLLHKSFYEDIPPFRSTDEYVRWLTSLPPHDISWFETHGDWFAENVLVPTTQLEKICYEVVAKYQDQFAKFAEVPDDFWSYISNEVATYFEVNPPVVNYRIKREGIQAKIEIRG